MEIGEPPSGVVQPVEERAGAYPVYALLRRAFQLLDDGNEEHHEALKRAVTELVPEGVTLSVPFTKVIV